MSFTLQEIVESISGKLICGSSNKVITTFIEQPLTPSSNSLYFLLEGYENEEHLLSKLLKHKASGVVIRKPHWLSIDKWLKSGLAVVEVPSVRDAYLDTAKYYRSKFQIPFIEVIGSSGKTTTKEMIGSVLKESIPTLVGNKNYNAPSGVAYNIFKLRKHHRAAVLEVGMKYFNIINLSSSIIKPNIGVITSIHRAHYTSLGSIENIIKAKSELLNHLTENDILIVNGEDKNCSRLPLNKFKGKILKFGFSPEFDIWASNIKYKDFKTFFKAQRKDFEINCVINTFGKYNVSNALAAILVGIELGLSPQKIAKGLSNYEPLTGRQQIFQGVNKSIIIHDNYNANPDSTKLLLNELPNITKNSPLILVIGDMERPTNQIEKYARKIHFDVGKQIAALNPYLVFAIGKWAKEYIKGAISKGLKSDKLIYFKSVNDSKDTIIKSIVPNSVVVFKAANSYIDFESLINKIIVKN